MEVDLLVLDLVVGSNGVVTGEKILVGASANRQFAALLKYRHIASEFHPGPGGHDWNQWNRRLDDAFQCLFAHLRTSPK